LANYLTGDVRPTAESDPDFISVQPGSKEVLTRAEALLRQSISSFDLPFRQPDLELIGVLGGKGFEKLMPSS
jgi:hypothetical protein